MPSEPTTRASTKQVRARYSDGQSARSWSCQIELGSSGLNIDLGDGSEAFVWPYSALRTHTAVSRGAGEAIVERRDMPGAQVDVRDAAFIKQLVRIAPQLSTGGMRRGWLMPLMIVLGFIVFVIAILWHLDVKPARTIARLLPDHMRLTLGRSVVGQFTSKGRTCTASGGQRAMEALKTRLLRGVPNAELYKVTVVDIPINNAFAAPGGQMVITRKLIQNANSPDEIAGILAHEIGHGIERHPEAGIIRVMGLSFILELISGGSTGGLGSLGLMFLQTSYVRQDEASADQQALRLLRRAQISPNGFADFFARNTRSACKPGDKNCTGAKRGKNRSLIPFDLLRTHPYPKDRLKVVRQIKPYASRPALSAEQWRQLQKICNQKQ